MANKGWNNYTGDGIHASSTDRQSGRGTEDGDFDGFAHGSTVGHPGPYDDYLEMADDRMEPTGQMSTTKPGIGGGATS